MKNLKLYILLVFSFCCSCKDYLEVKEQGVAIPKSAEEFSAILHARLNDMDYGSEEVVLGNARTILNYECYGDNQNTNLSTAGISLPIYVGSKINDFQSDYEELYAVIRDCNLILDNMEQRDSELGKNVLGTAYALRAVCYYNLMRNFCEPYDPERAEDRLGLPIVSTFDMEAKPVRSDLKTTAKFIEEDLKKAITYNVQEGMYRFTADVAKAYLARLYFWCQDWGNAIPVAKEILEKYPLLSGQEYTDMIQSQNTQKGNILLRSYVISGDFYSDSDYADAKRDAKYRPARKEFVDLFVEKGRDVRYAISFDEKRLNMKNIFSGVRSAEMCLILAESYAHQSNGTSEALSYLNQLREKRISDYVPYTLETLPEVNPNARIKVDATGASLTKLMSAIFDERRKELYMEGDRWFELKRNGRPEFWVARNGLKYETSTYLYTAPLPKNDIALLPGLIQNEGYE